MQKLKNCCVYFIVYTQICNIYFEANGTQPFIFFYSHSYYVRVSKDYIDMIVAVCNNNSSTQLPFIIINDFNCLGLMILLFQIGRFLPSFFLCSQISAIMSHMSVPGKACFQLLLPYSCSSPSCLKLTSDKLAKKRSDSLPNRVILRKSHGGSHDCFVTGNKIVRILKSKSIGSNLPGDLYNLIKQVLFVCKQLERNRR